MTNKYGKCPDCGLDMSQGGCHSCAFVNWCSFWHLPPPEGQVRFAPGRKFPFDFAWPAYKVAVEIQGGNWARGAHARASHLVNQYEKHNLAAVLGWQLYQFTPAQVIDGSAFQWMADHGVMMDQLDEVLDKDRLALVILPPKKRRTK